MAAKPNCPSQEYLDGHVRVYNGHQTQLPKHHVARQKLYLRATTDYWINAMDGQPFMVTRNKYPPFFLYNIVSAGHPYFVILAGMQESSHMDVKVQKTPSAPSP